MHDPVAGWLQTLGLEQYEACFRAHAIDVDVLPDLSDHDLESMGVLLGHRRRMLRAVASMQRHPATDQQTGNAAERNEAERRFLTVLFCDLVGSTRLSASHDPEDMREIIRAFQDVCMEATARYDGHVAKFMGDGALVYFGYPRAQEGEAERAVRAALDMSAAVEKRHARTGEALRARTGIASGLVVVGEVVGEGVAREQAVVGNAPNLAARLQAVARPGQVVVAESTRALLGRRFGLRDLGMHALAGLAEPARAWAVEGIGRFESKFQSERRQDSSGFFGRQREADQVLLAWQSACAGRGQAMLISGEAGIGKSRFVAEFDRGLAEDRMRLCFQCSPYHRTSALHPIIEQLNRAARINPGQTGAGQRRRLARLLAGVGMDREATLGLIGELLSIPGGEPTGKKEGASQQRRQTLAALLDLLAAACAAKPVLIMFEDVHWADATSLDFIDLTIARIATLPVLALITTRPEFSPPWTGPSHVRALSLGKLDRGDADAFIASLAGQAALPAATVKQIAANTDGIPLFIEELTKSVMESGVSATDGGRAGLRDAWPLMPIPATLHDSLMARLDRLAPVREIAQIAACIGREFGHSLLAMVAACDARTLDAALDRLQEAELVFRVDPPPHARYRFKHSLIQNAAYETLLRTRRQILHARIAEALCGQFPALAETEPELVAHHFARAGSNGAALLWWTRAGERALGRSAHVEAGTHLGNAIALADGQVDTPLAPAARLRLQLAYAQALLAAHSHGAPVTIAAFARARALAVAGGGTIEPFVVVYGSWAGSYVRGDLAMARSLAAAMLAETGVRGSAMERGIAYRATGATFWCAGEPEAARTALEHALTLIKFDPALAPQACREYGLEPCVGTLLALAIVLWQLGDVTQPSILSDRALAISEQTEHVPTRAYAQGWSCLLYVLRGDRAAACRVAASMLDLSREHALGIWKALATLFFGWAQIEVDHELLAEMREVIASFRRDGYLLYLTFFPMLLADTEARAGNAAAAAALLDTAIQDSERSGQCWFLPELLRHRAALTFHGDGNGEARILFARNPAPASEIEDHPATARG